MNKIFFLLLVLMISGCGDKEEVSEKSQRQTFISTAQSQFINFSYEQSSMGVIEGLIDPTVSAEINGTVIKMHVRTGSTVKKGELLAEIEGKDYQYQVDLAEAEIRLLRIRLANQTKILERSTALVDKKFISPNALDNIATEKSETYEGLEVAKSKLDIAKSNFDKTKIYAPINGKVQKQIASIGDYLKMGDGVFQIINNKKVRAHIPFPEHLAKKIKPGMKMQLTSAASQTTITVNIAELKPSINEESRSIDVIADISNLPDWQPGSTVHGTIIFNARQSVAVPEQSVVQRPSGSVVYVIEDSYTKANKVKTGITQNGFIEILSGLDINQTVAVDGAAFLTYNIIVNISNPS